MKLNYIAYGFSMFLICLILGIFFGSLLIWFNYEHSQVAAITLVNFLLIFCGYSFAKKAELNRYRNSLLFAVMISFCFVFLGFLIKGFNVFFLFKSFLIVFVFISIGVLFHYLKFDFKK